MSISIVSMIELKDFMQNNTRNRISIAAFEKNIIKRNILVFLEKLLGITVIDKLYGESIAKNTNDNFWSSAIKVLNIDLEINYQNDAEVPRQGPLIVVCNHPFGIIDGILIGKIISFYRDDYMFLANSALQKIPEIKDRIIPVDLSTLEKKNSKSSSLSSMRKVHSHLNEGGVLIIFPGGEVSSAQRIWDTPVDPVWSPLPVKLSRTFNCGILPIFIHGSSSLLFQFVTKISFSLRKYFLFREVLKKRNKSISLTVNYLQNIEEFNQNFDDAVLSNEIYATMIRDSKHLP